MSSNQDGRLDEMLKARRIEPASPDLAQRIILKAQQNPHIEAGPLMQWLRRLFGEFHLPRPAYVLASTLVVGVVLGFYMPVPPVSDAPDAATVQSFLYVDEELL